MGKLEDIRVYVDQKVILLHSNTQQDSDIGAEVTISRGRDNLKVILGTNTRGKIIAFETRRLSQNELGDPKLPIDEKVSRVFVSFDHNCNSSDCSFVFSNQKSYLHHWYYNKHVYWTWRDSRQDGRFVLTNALKNSAYGTSSIFFDKGILSKTKEARKMLCGYHGFGGAYHFAPMALAPDCSSGNYLQVKLEELHHERTTTETYGGH